MVEIDIKETTLNRLTKIAEEIDTRHYEGYVKDPAGVIDYLIGWYHGSLKK